MTEPLQIITDNPVIQGGLARVAYRGGVCYNTANATAWITCSGKQLEVGGQHSMGSDIADC